MIGRLWKRDRVHELTTALFAFVLYDLLGHDDTNVSPGAYDITVPAIDGMNGVQCADWHLVGQPYELV
jgi:hypothetical protein